MSTHARVDRSFVNPRMSLLAKLGSIVVHVEEMLSPVGHGFDEIALQSLLNDPEVQEWLAVGRSIAMIPEKR